MPPSNERKALHAYVSDKAHAAWHEYASVEGISVSALLEEIAPNLNALLPTTIVKNARRTDAERRRRTSHL